VSLIQNTTIKIDLKD